jgi:membrane protein DedA with SNARE-associated domain
VIPLTLGAVAVPARIFIPLNAIGALVWAVAIGYAGYLFGKTLESVFGQLKHVELWLMLAIALIAVLLWVIRFWRSRRQQQDSPR